MALDALSFQATVTLSMRGKIGPQGDASANTLPPPAVNAGGNARQQLAFGTASGKADIACAVQDTLAAGASKTYDLYAGTGGNLADLFGGAAPLRTLRAVAVVIAAGGDAAGVRVGGAASNAHPLFFADASDRQVIAPGGLPFVQGTPAGVAVTGTARNLKIENLGAVGVTFTLFLVGASV